MCWRSCYRAAAWAIVMLSTSAGQALGQYALGDGTALDANLQVGAGKKNTKVRNLDAQIRYNNAIITGQALGGKSFRGNVGYRAVDEFSGLTGADSLYSFRRDSAYSSAPTLGIRGSDAIRYQFALSTGAVVPTGFARAGWTGAMTRSGATTSGAIDTRVNGTALPTTALRSTSQFAAQRALRPTLVGYREDEDGDTFALTASPLLSVSLYKTGEGKKTQEERFIPGAAREEAELREPTDLARAKRAGVRSPLTGLESSAVRAGNTLDRFGTATTALVDTSVPSTQVQAQTLLHQRVLTEFGQAYELAQKTAQELEKEGAQKEALKGLTWEQELVRVRATLRGEDPVKAVKDFEKKRIEEKKEKATKGAEEQKSDLGKDARSGAAMGEVLSKTQQEDLERIERETKAYQEAGKRMGMSSTTLEALKAAGVRFEKLEGGLSQQAVKPGSQAMYEDYMRTGQELLSKGRFFDAEDRFTRALASLPGDPMASVGRVHAQIGAGLYLSAAMNLRRLLTDYPEMIGATYGSNLVPDAQRLKKIRAQLLDELAKQSDMSVLGRDAALLLGYVGHIAEDRATAEQGIKEFRKRVSMMIDEDAKARDEDLLTIIEGLWLGAKPMESPASEKNGLGNAHAPAQKEEPRTPSSPPENSEKLIDLPLMK